MTDQTSNNVLLVEDSPVYERIIGGHLRNWGFNITSARDGEAAWSMLQQPQSPRLLLMDWVMPKMDGLELCRRLRLLPSSFPYTYTVLLTGKGDRKDLLTAMEAGVDDYLCKPFDELELKARLLAGKRVVALQNKLLAAQDSLRYTASHDGLTGIMNRNEIMSVLQREVARSNREHTQLAVAMVDVDHFKNVNDELGHLFGDEALKETARRLQSQLRVYDSIGRFGGEELLMILPGCDLTSALIRMDQLRASVCRTPVHARGKNKTITVSIGVAVTGGNEKLELNDLLAQADKALYQAKENGRNRVEHADDQPMLSEAV